MVTTVGPVYTTILNVSGLETPSGGQSLCKHAVTLAKLGSSITHQTIPNSLVGKGVQLGGHHTQFLGSRDLNQLFPKLWLRGLHLGPLDKGEICPMVAMGLEGCNTFSQPGNLFGGLFSAVDFMVMSMVASFTGAPAGVGWALWGVTSLGGMRGSPLVELCPWTHPHWRRRGSISSLPKALFHSPPKGMVYLQ